MENQTSQPTLVLPAIPPNFDSIAGTSKSDYAAALFELLKGAIVTGIVSSSPIPYDLAALTTDVAQLKIDVAALNKKIRRITVSGVSNGEVTIPFQDIGTTNYDVDVAFVWTSGGPFPDSLNWAIVGGSKQTFQVKIRCDGNAATFDLDVVIRER